MPQFCFHDPGIRCPVCNPYGPQQTVYVPYVQIVPTTAPTTPPPGSSNKEAKQEVQPPDLTEAEKFFDSVVVERRAKGRQTYGRGLTHTDEYDWNRMAMEEAMDLAQYLAAENTRLRDRIKQQVKAIAELTYALEQAK